jgi:hypothetical protein
MKLRLLLPTAVLGLVALAFAVPASLGAGEPPTFVTNTVDDTTFFAQTR